MKTRKSFNQLNREYEDRLERERSEYEEERERESMTENDDERIRYAIRDRARKYDWGK